MKTWLRMGVVVGTLGFGGGASCGATPTANDDHTALKTSGELGHEMTIGVPVPDLDVAVEWYTELLGRQVESMEPTKGIVELRIAAGVWLQLFVVDAEQFQATSSILRFKTSNIDAEAVRLRVAGIQVGEIIRVPEVVEFTEFVDPFGNPVSLYEVEAAKQFGSR